MKNVISFLMLVFGFSCFVASAMESQSLLQSSLVMTPAACPLAVPTTASNFCSSFKSVAACHCLEKSIPPVVCQDMGKIYAEMMAFFGSLKAACALQKDTPPQTCEDDWNCYRNGGRNSQGALCSSTGSVC